LARVQPFSRERHRAFIDTSIATFDTTRLREGARAAIEDRTPVFIVGLPRSGTSLVEQIVAAHPSVHGAGERAALHSLIRSAAGPALEVGAVHRLAGLTTDALTEAARNFLGELRAEAPNARFIIDKMPGNALHLGFLATLLPGARVILCRRDLRDIGLSIFQLRFFGYHPYAHDLADLGFYMAEHARLMAHWKAVLPLPLIEISLTDWIDDFQGTLARLLAFLDLPHDPACERFYESGRRVRTASAAQVRQPVNARGIGRWSAYAQHLGPMLAELEAGGAIETGMKN
jgi:hypothetical protein